MRRSLLPCQSGNHGLEAGVGMLDMLGNTLALFIGQ
jgi:hypothetical protein